MEKNKQPKLINPAELFDPSPYGFSHSIAVESPSTMCFISGQSGGLGENHVLADNFKTQVQDATLLENKSSKILLPRLSKRLSANSLKFLVIILNNNKCIKLGIIVSTR